jgi:hypothetical protein
MSVGGNNNGEQDGNGVKALRAPALSITFDPRTYKVDIAGSCPTLEFAQMLAGAAYDELERQIAQKRALATFEQMSAGGIRVVR